MAIPVILRCSCGAKIHDQPLNNDPLFTLIHHLAGHKLEEKMQPREHMQEAKKSFEGGATRSEKLERFDLIPPEADEAMARRFGLGAKKHGEGNWKGGGKDFIKACINHAKAHEAHLGKAAGKGDDNDLDAIICNWGMLCWFRENKAQEYGEALAELKGPVEVAESQRLEL
jgi:hypothetical protein